MDPRAFVKVSVGALGVRVAQQASSKPPARAGIHSSTSPFFCEIRLPGYPTHLAPVPLVAPSAPAPDHRGIAASFYIDESGLEKLLSSPSCLRLRSQAPRPCLEVLVYTGRQKEGKLLGTFSLPVEAQWLEGKPAQLHCGWSAIGGSSSKPGGGELHVSIRIEADPRYMFQFDNDTVLSPQIVQIQGSLTQPLFSCKFSRDRLSRSRLGLCETPRCGKWSGPLGGGHEKERKERKGWLVMIHDLSGSPVAAASMVTPFVPSAGRQRVSRSNPGAWLILRPEAAGEGWEPWGRLEAWREMGGSLGLRFQLANGALLAEAAIGGGGRGEFVIDTMKMAAESGGEWHGSSGGFVMSCSVGRGEKQRRPLVQLAMRHITCAEDAAVFMALAAALDLSIDACQPFSRKLRKELA